MGSLESDLEQSSTSAAVVVLAQLFVVEELGQWAERERWEPAPGRNGHRENEASFVVALWIVQIVLP